MQIITQVINGMKSYQQEKEKYFHIVERGFGEELMKNGF